MIIKIEQHGVKVQAELSDHSDAETVRYVLRGLLLALGWGDIIIKEDD